MGSYWTVPDPQNTITNIATSVGTIVTAVTVPAANSTANVYVRDVVGNKTDSAVTTVGTTASIIAYIKGFFTTLALQASTTETGDMSFTAGTSGAYSAWQQLIASTAAKAVQVTLSIGYEDGAALNHNSVFQFGTGGAGTETARATFAFECLSTNSGGQGLPIVLNIPAGTRLAVRAKDSAITGLFYAVGYTIQEV